MKKYEFTTEHRAELKPWAEKWIANGMSTKPMDAEDKAAMVAALKGQYEAANFPWHGRVVFVPSPFVARFAAGFASCIWYLRKTFGSEATDEATRQATSQATYEATRQATSQATDALADLSKWFVVDCDWLALATLLKVGKLGLRCAQEAWYMWRGGNQWSGWVAYISFFRHVAKLGESHKINYSKWEHYEQATIHGGPQYFHKEFVMVSDRPRVLKVDDQNRPHCMDGPFCAWSDGSALFAVHGVRVPAWIILKPEQITVAKIEAEANAEIRRIMVDKYGIERYLVEAGAEEIHKDSTGILYRKEMPNDEAIVMVRVVNSTAEPDGTFKEYFLRVAPDLRPLADGSWERARQEEWTRSQRPQALTARNAVASTFGLRGEEYEPVMES